MPKIRYIIVSMTVEIHTLQRPVYAFVLVCGVPDIATDFFWADNSCLGIAIHFLTMANSKAKVLHGSNFHFLT